MEARLDFKSQDAVEVERLNKLVTYFQTFFTWTDWALPIRVNHEPENLAWEFQIGPWHLITFKREDWKKEVLGPLPSFEDLSKWYKETQ